MKIKGWKHVFAFTFTQQVKTKSFIIGTIVISLIVALMAFLADYLPTVFLSDTFDKMERAANGENTLTVKQLYVCDETDQNFNFVAWAVTTGMKCKMLTAEEADAQQKLMEAPAESSTITEGTMLSRIKLADNAFTIDSSYTGGIADIDKNDCNAVNGLLAEQVRKQYLASLGVASDKLDIAMSSIGTTLTQAGEEQIGMVQGLINSLVPMLSSIVLFIFIFSYSSLVAQSVAIEKSSRIIEYLLTSVKPLAIILGKVLAMCCVSLMQFLIIIASGAIGFIISLPIGVFSKFGSITSSLSQSGVMDDDSVSGILNQIKDAFSNVDASVFVVMVVVFILGFLLFAGLAGLAGSSVSKMEDLAPAMQPISLIGVLGFYLAYFPQVTGEENTMTVLARYIPISSPFILPSDYLLGKIGVGELLIGIGILAVSVVLVVMLVAKVYESIILHTGNRLKLGDMLKMSK